MGAEIEGKVAAVIDDTTLVLNIGSEQGVVEGTVFAIFATHGQIVDSDSGEALGLWEMVKAQDRPAPQPAINKPLKGWQAPSGGGSY